MKKLYIIAILLILAAATVVAGCGDAETSTTAAPIDASTSTTAAPSTDSTAAAAPSTTAAAPASGETIEIKAIGFLPGMAAKAKYFQAFCDEVNKAAAGELVINVLGGPEVIGQPEMGSAVSSGVVQMAMIPPGFMESSFKEGSLLLLSRVSYEEEIASGVYDQLQPFFNDKGKVQLLGRLCGSGDPLWTLHLNKKVSTPADLSGLTVGSTGTQVLPLIEALGMELKAVPLADAYTALERGLVSGYLSPANSLIATSAQEQVKYGISDSFFIEPAVIVVNLDTWNKLPAHLQKLLNDTLAKMAPEFGRMNNEDEAKSRKAFEAAGVEYISFAPADATKYLDTIYDAMWDSFEKQLPDTAPAIRKLLTP